VTLRAHRRPPVAVLLTRPGDVGPAGPDATCSQQGPAPQAAIMQVLNALHARRDVTFVVGRSELA
jgi:hypothetical protein